MPIFVYTAMIKDLLLLIKKGLQGPFMKTLERRENLRPAAITLFSGEHFA